MGAATKGQTFHPLPDAALEADIAILGKKGRGKTYTAKGIVERLLKMNRRVLILDPLNVWWGLRSDASGEGPGFPVAVFGGPNGDMPLTEQMARPLARLIAHNNLPAVVDMSDMRKGAWQRLVRDMLDELFTKNRDPLWIILEEADIFAPQQPREGDSNAVLGEVDRIARRGRAFGFRLISLTQRPARLHKDVLTQLSSLIALGVTSPQDRDAIKSWVDGNADRDAAKQVMASLASLPVGEGWIWVPDLALLERAKFPPIVTLDNSATPLAGEKRIEPKKLADVDLTEIRAALEGDHDDSATAPAPRLSAKEKAALEAAAYERGFAEGKATGERQERLRLKNAIEKAVSAVLDGHETPAALLPVNTPTNPVSLPPTRPAAPTEPMSRPELSPSAQRVLDVVVNSWPNVHTYAVAAARAGISRKSSAYRSYLKELLEAGLVAEASRGLEPIGRARELAGPMPQGLDQWISKLPPSQARMLTALKGAPAGLTREALAEHSGVSLTSSGLGSSIRNLRDIGLVAETDGMIQLTI